MTSESSESFQDHLDRQNLTEIWKVKIWKVTLVPEASFLSVAAFDDDPTDSDCIPEAYRNENITASDSQNAKLLYSGTTHLQGKLSLEIPNTHY